MSERLAAASTVQADVAFGDCLVMVARRRLLRGGAVVELGDRAFELLLALIDGYGGVVSKDQLIARVWPGRIVEENTLEGKISLLRRALAADRAAIKTIAGRGYQFVADLGAAAPAADPPPPLVEDAQPPALLGNRLPSRVSQLLGRETALAELTELAQSNRLITLVGTGGIGKTRLAVEVARLLAPAYRDGAFLAELGSVVSADFVATSVGAALGFPPGDGMAAPERIAALIFSKQLLLVLDNCEHLIAASAQLVARLLRASPGICIIATSREALRIEGEYVYRVASLDVPDSEQADGAALAASGALQLFQARLGGGAAAAPLRQLALQVRICRRLDGIPLALELAAARVAVLGLADVAERLDDRFQLLTNGARTALPRQQTLRATLDWSYELLDAGERAVLAQLSIFAGTFTLEAALAILATAQQPAGAVADGIASLVDKSLLSLMPHGEAPRYRLLETTRVYAAEKFLAGERRNLVALAHARYYLALFESGEHEAKQGFTAEWRSRYASHLEDFRAAVRWSFAPAGDADIGVRLTLAGMPLALQLGLLTESIARVAQALSCLERDGMTTDARRMKLYAARGTALLYQTFASDPDTEIAYRQTLALAEALGDSDHQKYGVWGCWCCCYLNGAYAQALQLAQRFRQLAADSGALWDMLVADRIVGLSHLCLGQLADSRLALERMLAGVPASVSRTERIRFLYDEKMYAHAALAQTLYQQGYPEQAMRMALRSQADASELGHVPSLCYALSEAVCTIALLTGDQAGLAQAVAQLDNTTRQHGVTPWKARARMWTALAPLRQGHLEAYDQVIVPALAEIGPARFFITITPLLATIARLLGEHGRVDDGVALIASAIARARASGDACSLVELTRTEAQLLWLRDGAAGEAALERQLSTARDLARQHGSLSLELRCVMDLTRLWLRRATPQATAMLRAVRARYTEGGNSADLREADALLARGDA